MQREDDRVSSPLLKLVTDLRSNALDADNRETPQVRIALQGADHRVGNTGLGQFLVIMQNASLVVPEVDDLVASVS